MSRMSRQPFGTSKVLALVATIALAVGASWAFVPEDGLEMLWLASDGTSLVGYGRLQDAVLELEVRGDGFGFGVLTVTRDGAAHTFVGSVVDGRPRVRVDGTTHDLATYLAVRGVELRLRDADGAVMAVAPLAPVPVAATAVGPAAPGDAPAAADAPAASAGGVATRPAEAGDVRAPDGAGPRSPRPDDVVDAPAVALEPLPAVGLPAVDPPLDPIEDVADAVDEAAAGGIGIAPALGDEGEEDGAGGAAPTGEDTDDEVRHRDTRGTERAQERREARGPDPAPQTDASGDATADADDTEEHGDATADEAPTDLVPLPDMP